MIRNGWIMIACLLIAGSVEAQADDMAPGGEARPITVRLLEYHFDPAEIVLKANEEVELTLINDGKVMHEFVTEVLQFLSVTVEINGTVAETLGLVELEIPPQSSVVLRFTPEKPGDFLIACRATATLNHTQEGMRGRLLVR